MRARSCAQNNPRAMICVVGILDYGGEVGWNVPITNSVSTRAGTVTADPQAHYGDRPHIQSLYYCY
jgi:hypothetical protein